MSTPLAAVPGASGEATPTKGTGRSRPWRRFAALAFLIVFFWPSQWGGIFSLAVVQGDSMEPAFTSGALAVAVREPWGPSIGQTIVFTPLALQQSDVRIVHRVVGVNPGGGFVTQGDNVGSPDPWVVPADDVAGVVVFAIPGAGSASARFVIPILLGTIAGAILVVILWPRRSPDAEGSAAGILGDIGPGLSDNE